MVLLYSQIYLYTENGLRTFSKLILTNRYNGRTKEYSKGGSYTFTEYTINNPAQMPLDPPLLKSNVVITPSTFKIGDTINIRFETDKLIAPENIGWRLLYKTPSNQTPSFVDGDFLPDCSCSTCIWNGPFTVPNLNLYTENGLRTFSWVDTYK